MKKLLLLHGAGIASSRKKLIDFKKDFDPNNVIVFEEGSDIQTILGSMATPSLLEQQQLIILENPPEDLTFDSSLITHHSSLVLWFDHEVTASKPILIWTKRNGGEILNFGESKEVSIFPFLDLLVEGNEKAFLELNKLKTFVLPTGRHPFDIFYFITMTYYLLRTLVTTPKNAPKFAQDKIQNQRVKFKKRRLEALYKNILELEFKIKSGLLEQNQAEFFLIYKFFRN